MRISRLDLLRYGKFTDRSVSLPQAGRDFHLVMGPNEAGKSTLRNAVQDLFFGIETRSRYNFLHPYSEMRLGALIEQGTSKLDFIRTKARTKTLQAIGSAPLPDNALMPFLGPVDRVFFDQMFGLNHERLVSGGQEILSASNDIGQILFQAAAGIGSLGEMRDRLEAEANQLWARRKSSDREYYMASAELEQAEAALKQLTVRTKDWQAARTQVDQLGEALTQARERYQVLEQARIELERVRRVAPTLGTLAALEAQLADLGEVILLPENASEQLARAEHELAMASASHQLFQQQATHLSEQMAALHPDETLLARSTDIEALSTMRQQWRNLENDIAKRQGEIQVLWQDVQDSARQLGWPDEAEEALTQRLPGSLVRCGIGQLIRRHEVLVQAGAVADEAQGLRQEEIKAISAQIEGLPELEISVALMDGLAAARSLGDVDAQDKRAETQMGRLQRDLEAATLALGAWAHEPERLRLLLPPSQDEIQSQLQHRSELVLLAAGISERMVQTHAEIASLQLEISQYRATHQPVTLTDVRGVRALRDAAWHAIRSGASTLAEAAAGYERRVTESDTLSDQRHDRAQAETELQAKLDRLQRLQLQSDELQSRGLANAQALDAFDQHWNAQTRDIGLAGMPLLKVNDWRAARERVLMAAAALQDAQAAQRDLARSVARVSAALTQALLAFKPEARTLRLTGLILLADELVTATTRTRERREALLSQKIRAEAALPDLNKRLAQARSALDTWQIEWQKNFALLHLPPQTSRETVDASLVLFERMHQHLQKIRDIRVNRIDMMRRDLQAFDVAAQSLAKALAPDINNEPTLQIALSLERRLKQESDCAQALDRLRHEFKKTAAQAQAANQRMAESSASLAPLLRLSAMADNEGLRVAIECSDRLRQLTLQTDQTLKQLLVLGDGLPRATLEAEFKATEVTRMSARLSDLKLQIDEVVAQQNRLSGELNAAETELGKIAGQAQAARAESQRQEALARMSNAVQRYLKVHTAAKLLRWSIERFRESRQGPMLARASDIFCGLTQSTFSRLVVDYESEPLKLSGQRANAELVGIEGMSEGTRDQLYLALRLAALELHLAQTEALPFIADDLFINYDEGRARAGLQALADLSGMTQVIFLSHHAHLVPLAQSVLGEGLNVVYLG